MTNTEGTEAAIIRNHLWHAKERGVVTDAAVEALATLEAALQQARDDLFAARQAVLTEGTARNEAEATIERLTKRAEKAEHMLEALYPSDQRATIERLRAALEEIGTTHRGFNQVGAAPRMRYIARTALNEGSPE